MAKTQTYMDYLDEQIEIAPAGSQEEYQAAESLAGIMREHGLETSVSEFDASPWGTVMPAVLMLVLVVGMVVCGLTTGVIHVVALLLAVAAAGVLLLSHFGPNVLEGFGPSVTSQNVVGIHRAEGDKVQKGARPIVIVAHYDTPRRDPLYTQPLARYQALIRRSVVPCCIVAAACLFVQALALLPQIVRTVAWVVGILGCVPLLAKAVLTIMGRAGACTMGANDNKSSVAAMLAILDAVRPADDAASDSAGSTSHTPRRPQRAQEEAEPEARPRRVEVVEEVKGVRHGQDVLLSLGMLPPTCEVLYEEPKVRVVEEDVAGEREYEPYTADQDTADQYGYEPDELEPEVEDEWAAQDAYGQDEYADEEDAASYRQAPADDYQDYDDEALPDDNAYEDEPFDEYEDYGDAEESQEDDVREDEDGYEVEDSEEYADDEDLDYDDYDEYDDDEEGEEPPQLLAGIGSWFSTRFDALRSRFSSSGSDEEDAGDEDSEDWYEDYDLEDDEDALDFAEEDDADEYESAVEFEPGEDDAEDAVADLDAEDEDAYYLAEEETPEEGLAEDADADLDFEFDEELLNFDDEDAEYDGLLLEDLPLIEDTEEDAPAAAASVWDEEGDEVEEVLDTETSESDVVEAEDVAVEPTEPETQDDATLEAEPEDTGNYDVPDESYVVTDDEEDADAADLVDTTDQEAEVPVAVDLESVLPSVLDDEADDEDFFAAEVAFVEEEEDYVVEDAEELLEYDADYKEDEEDDEYTAEYDAPAEDDSAYEDSAYGDAEYEDDEEYAEYEPSDLDDEEEADAEEYGSAEAVEESDDVEESFWMDDEADEEDYDEEYDDAAPRERRPGLLQRIRRFFANKYPDGTATEDTEEPVDDWGDDTAYDDYDDTEADYGDYADDDVYEDAGLPSYEAVTADAEDDEEYEAYDDADEFDFDEDEYDEDEYDEDEYDEEYADYEEEQEPAGSSPAPASDADEYGYAAYDEDDAEPEDVASYEAETPYEDDAYDAEVYDAESYEDDYETYEQDVEDEYGYVEADYESDDYVDDVEEEPVPEALPSDPNLLHFDREEAPDIVPRDTTGLDEIADSYDMYDSGEIDRVTPREAPTPVDDPDWGVSTYRPASSPINIARRAALYDLPDPSGSTIDPFDTGEYDVEDFSSDVYTEDLQSDDSGRRSSFWGGATVRDDLRDDAGEPLMVDADDLQEAILELGDDFLVAHDIWFVATGASELGHAGIKAFIDEHRRDIRGAFLVNLEAVGAGDLTVLTNEGLRAPRRADRRLVKMLTSIAQDLHIDLSTGSRDWGDTDATSAMRQRVRAVTLTGLDGDVPMYSHSDDDVPENVDPGQVSAVVRLVTELIRRA